MTLNQSNIASTIYDKTSSYINSKKGQQAIDVIVFIMECIEKYDLEGVTKREIAQNVLIKIMDTCKIGDGSVNQQIKTILTSNLYQNIVDNIVNATKKKFDINKKQIKNCFPFCPIF